MDPSKLADRLRAIVKTPGPKGPGLHGDPGPLNDDVGRVFETRQENTAQILGGDWCGRDGGACFVVERRHLPDTKYGCDRVATFAARLAEAAADLPLVMGGAPVRPPFAFFDLETTGLSGGAGTYAFLVGCGAFDEDGGFLTRQFVLLRHADERPLLQMVGAELSAAGALVTFNGKSFDAPLIETRYQYHRFEWAAAGLPHLDVLHPARRFWSDGAASPTPCSLQVLENVVLGARRPSVARGRRDPHAAVRNDRQLHADRRASRRAPHLLHCRARGQRAVGARRLGLDACAGGRTVIPIR